MRERETGTKTNLRLWIAIKLNYPVSRIYRGTVLSKNETDIKYEIMI
jgi:hypothetical protein